MRWIRSASAGLQTGEQLETGELFRPHIGPGASSDPHAGVDVGRVEIGELGRRVNPQRHARMRGVEAGEARHQPFRRQHRRDGDGEDGARTRLGGGDRAGDFLKAARQIFMSTGAPAAVGPQTPRRALEDARGRVAPRPCECAG